MKKITFFILLIITIFSLSACSKERAANTSNSRDHGFRRPDFGQPERPADIRGLVKSVIGNEVVVIKLERPKKAAGDNEIENSEKNSKQTKTLSPGAAFGGKILKMRGNRRSDMDKDNRAAMLERIKEMGSEEETIIIPVGIRMLKPDTDRTEGRLEMIEATLADVKPDKIISVWLDKNVTDRKIASFVLVMK